MRRRLPTFFRSHEADALVASAKNERDRLIIQCGLFLGLRCSEITDLRIERINLTACQVLVAHGKGDKDRYVPIPERLRPLLQNWIGDRREGLLFTSRSKHGRLSNRAVQRMFQSVARKAGIAGVDQPRKVTPHKLRHTYATTLLEKGANIRELQELLGHSSVATTEIYTHVVTSRLKGVVDRL
jgi:integrase/recombinase XerD